MSQPAYSILSAPFRTERRHPRVPVNLSVVVEAVDSAPVEAAMVNLGFGGAFILSSAPLSYGSQVWLHVRLPLNAPATLRLPAIVRWSNKHGFGVQFLQLGARATHAIGAVVNTR